MRKTEDSSLTFSIMKMVAKIIAVHKCTRKSSKNEEKEAENGSSHFKMKKLLGDGPSQGSQMLISISGVGHRLRNPQGLGIDFSGHPHLKSIRNLCVLVTNPSVMRILLFVVFITFADKPQVLPTLGARILLYLMI
jgi:hypothetical protein